MLKNLTVLKKILVAFGIVILLLVTIAVTSTVTAVRRSNDLTRANLLSDMLTAANETLDHFNDSRVASEVALTSLDAESAYETFFAGLDSALDGTDKLDGYSAQLGGYAADDTATIRQRLEHLYATMESIQGNDGLMAAELAALIECANEMSVSAAEVYAAVSGLTGEVVASESMDADAWMAMMVNPVQDLNVEIGTFRIVADTLTVGLDSSVIPDLEARLSSIEANAQAVMDKMQDEQERATLNVLLQDIQDYRDTMARFADVMLESEGYIAEMYADMDEIAALVHAGVDKVTSETNSILEATMAESNSALLLMIIICAVAIAIAIADAFILSKDITRPIKMMESVLVQVGQTGSLSFSGEFVERFRNEGKYKSELGQSIKAFAQMMDRLLYVGDRLTEVANGDLTADIELLSTEDTMGVALKNMSDSLNDMFGEINNAAGQVSTASTEIATGSQTLAQGSTEQASTVEEISASINEINEQAGVSAETADKAAREGEEIRSVASQGSEKMKGMMDAVQQINDASAAIGQVIKVIDDIAFQTNILALNAAVEAARAGEHGKGFAVVADEVRNLAGKSADAAKETANLISANIEKAELGLSISQDTAASLNQIVDGIQRTSESLVAMSQQSSAVRAAATQVNQAVDQVAQVVQQNSATSEESAAASEEMSSQAQMLQQLISRFQLKESGHGQPAALPPVSALPPAPMSAHAYDSSAVIF